MKIGIDARFWNETGVGRYIRHIVGELSVLDQQNDYTIFLLEKDFESVVLPSNFKKVRTNIHWHSLSEQIILPLVFAREHLELLFVPHFNVPVLYPGKFVTTIHDLTPLKVRTGRVTTLPYPIYLIKYLGALFVYFVAAVRSAKIFTVSESVKKDLTKYFKIRPGKIVITPCAVDENFYRRSDSDIKEVLAKYQVSQLYLFYVGNAYPHKNLETLIRAFEIVSKSRPDLALVLGGKNNFFYDRLKMDFRSSPVYGRLVFTDFIDDVDLPFLYSGAEALVNPSLYEGFGIQTLEAFACGCKVICSNTTSLPEIGLDLADYFDPTNVQNMAQVITLALGKTRSDFATKAQARVRDFSWKTSAQTVLEVMKSL